MSRHTIQDTHYTDNSKVLNQRLHFDSVMCLFLPLCGVKLNNFLYINVRTNCLTLDCSFITQ